MIQNSSPPPAVSKKSNISISEFVLQESREKCFEIEVLILKDFQSKKSQIVDREYSKLKQQYDQKYNNVLKESRIRRSNLINDSRLTLMKSRNLASMKVFSDMQYKLFDRIRSDKGFYRDLLKKLIIQGIIKLFEHHIKIRCLEQDIPLVRELIGDVTREFQAKVKDELEIDFDLKLEVDEQIHLSQRVLENRQELNVLQYSEEMAARDVIQKNQDDKQCFGGVILTSEDGLIICQNTLDIRADLCFQDSLPEIRSTLFPSNFSNNTEQQ